MKMLALGTLMVTSLSAFATIDSFVSVYVPVQKMQSSGVCLVETIAWDGYSNAESHEATLNSTLNGAFKVHTLGAGEDSEGFSDVNFLTTSGVKVDIAFVEGTFSKRVVTVDATEATSKATTLVERQSVIRRVQIAIVAAMKNALTGQVKTAKLLLKGLPSQDGLLLTVPTSFKSEFSRTSPYLKLIMKEMEITEGAKTCF